jgi:hypothetical protein
MKDIKFKCRLLKESNLKKTKYYMIPSV